MASTQANTWPPLISSGSWDDLGQKHLYGQTVLASTLFEASPDDEFYFPVDGVLSGYSADGILFQNGAQVPDADRASWFTEDPGPFRGAARAFPQRGLVLVTDAGLSIISLEDRYAMWMIALRGDNLGFTHNFLGSITGFTPSTVTYQNGRIITTLEPDAGSAFKAPVFVVFDLLQDRIYMDLGAYKVPIVGPYERDPVAYRVGNAIVPNTCAVDPDGGAPTYWGCYPPLPAGLVLDPETGTITGTPTVDAAQRVYAVVAYNPGGEGSTTLDLQVLPPPPTPHRIGGGWMGGGCTAP